MLAGAVIALIYSVLAGFTGVVVTDFLQFILAMLGSLLLAVFVLAMPEVGGLPGLVEQLTGGIARDLGDQQVNVPVLHMLPGRDTPYFTLSLMLIPLFVSWWSVVYGGMEPGGGGQVVQRMLAAKNEKHAVGASLWFNVAHFALRMWPWLLVGLAAVILYPDTTNFKSVYAQAIRDVLPAGLRGLLVASFFAAFISTMDTRLNLGSAYLVNDFYRRFAARDKREAHYVLVSRVVTVLACLVPFAVPYLFQRDILKVVMFWMQITAGTGLVFILRWYWWRINAWSEISAMVSAVVYTMLLLWLKYDWDIETYTRPDISLYNILYVTIMTTITWVAATLMTRPEDREGLREFYRRTRPAGRGWRPVAQDLESESIAPADDLRACFIGWVSASVFLFAAFYGAGKLLLLEFGWGMFWVAVSIAALLVSLKAIRRVFA
jgi:Na+/proline symporter